MQLQPLVLILNFIPTSPACVEEARVETTFSTITDCFPELFFLCNTQITYQQSRAHSEGARLKERLILLRLVREAYFREGTQHFNTPH